MIWPLLMHAKPEYLSYIEGRCDVITLTVTVYFSTHVICCTGNGVKCSTVATSMSVVSWSKCAVLYSLKLNSVVSVSIMRKEHLYLNSGSCRLWKEACGTFPLLCVCPDYTPLSLTSPSPLSRSDTRRSVQNRWQQHPSAEAFKCLLW